MKSSERARNHQAWREGRMTLFLAVAVLIILFNCTGCWNKKADPIPLGTGSYEIPVAVERFVDSVTDAEAPVEMIITVPASDKPTVVKVTKKRQGFIKRTLTNAPAHTVESNNPGATAEQPKRSMWKRWIGFGLGALVVGAMFLGWAWRRVRDWTG